MLRFGSLPILTIVDVMCGDVCDAVMWQKQLMQKVSNLKRHDWQEE